MRDTARYRQSTVAGATRPRRTGSLRRVLLAVGLFYGFYWMYFPRVAHLAVENPRRTAFIEQYQSREEARGSDGRIAQVWRPLSAISPYLKRAVIIAEDDTFFTHNGFNLTEIKRALATWRQGKRLRGASTITQQLAKNLYLSPSRNPLRKLRESIIAWRLEGSLEKPRILEIYLNVVEWGAGVYGAEAASQHYFGKGADHLTRREAAYLAAIIPNPIYLTKKSQVRQVKNRENKILSRLGGN